MAVTAILPSLPIVSDTIIAYIVSYINAYRAKHQAPPLTWDTTIQPFSQQYAEQLLATNTFKHSGNALYGENLAYFQNYGTDVLTLLKLSVDNWYNEVALYDYTKPQFSEATGHFTALVWKSCTSFAMGIAIDLPTKTALVTYNCLPPANYIGEFSKNVFPPTGTPVPVPVPVPTPTPIPVPIPVPVPVPTPVPVPLPNPMPIVCTRVGLKYSLQQIRNSVIRKRPTSETLYLIDYLIAQTSTCKNM
jgi:hypothetical protein